MVWRYGGSTPHPPGAGPPSKWDPSRLSLHVEPKNRDFSRILRAELVCESTGDGSRKLYRWNTHKKCFQMVYGCRWGVTPHQFRAVAPQNWHFWPNLVSFYRKGPKLPKIWDFEAPIALAGWGVTPGNPYVIWKHILWCFNRYRFHTPSLYNLRLLFIAKFCKNTTFWVLQGVRVGWGTTLRGV